MSCGSLILIFLLNDHLISLPLCLKTSSMSNISHQRKSVIVCLDCVDLAHLVFKIATVSSTKWNLLHLIFLCKLFHTVCDHMNENVWDIRAARVQYSVISLLSCHLLFSFTMYIHQFNLSYHLPSLFSIRLYLCVIVPSPLGLGCVIWQT